MASDIPELQSEHPGSRLPLLPWMRAMHDEGRGMDHEGEPRGIDVRHLLHFVPACWLRWGYVRELMSSGLGCPRKTRGKAEAPVSL